MHHALATWITRWHERQGVMIPRYYTFIKQLNLNRKELIPSIQTTCMTLQFNSPLSLLLKQIKECTLKTPEYSFPLKSNNDNEEQWKHLRQVKITCVNECG